jgi:hypothetical protein
METMKKSHKKLSINTIFARHHYPSTSVTLTYTVIVML